MRLAIDTDNCILYEIYVAYPQAACWTAGSGAIFNLLSNALRPAAWTSTDAAGLRSSPAWSATTRSQREIRHALRFTVRRRNATCGPRATTHRH